MPAPEKGTPIQVLLPPAGGVGTLIPETVPFADLPVIDVIGSVVGSELLALLAAAMPSTAGLSPSEEASQLAASGALVPPGSFGTGGGQVTAAPLIPFNWWQLGQGGNPDLVGPLDPTILSRLGAAGETLFNYLFKTSQIGADPNATQQPVGSAGLPVAVPGGATSTPPAPLTTISVIGTVPAGAPPVVASPVLAPIGLPEQPPPAGLVPHFAFTVPVPTIPAPGLRPGAGPLAGPTIQPIFGPPSPTFSPVLNPGVVTAPTTTPAPGLVPSLVPSPLPGLAPGPSTGVNPTVATPLPVAQLPGLDFNAFAPLGFIAPSAASPFDQPEEQAFAQAASHANQCQTTKQKAKPRKPRTVCHAGTYIERARGTNKTPQRIIQCR